MKKQSRRPPKQPGKPSQLDDLRREVMQIGGGIVKGPLPAIYRVDACGQERDTEIWV
ncbi:MAG: hypothetical protein ACXV8M_01320 [Candidatus Angelobacter sp.]